MANTIWVNGRLIGGGKRNPEYQLAAEENLRLRAEIERLRAQLPSGMEHCTIVFKECSRGHGELTATNWVQHECLVCQIERLHSRTVTLPPLGPADLLVESGQGFVEGWTIQRVKDYATECLRAAGVEVAP